jgi:hypothetical protein
MRYLVFLLLTLPGFLQAQSWAFYGQGPGGKRYSA